MREYIGGIRQHNAYAPDTTRGEDWHDQMVCDLSTAHLFDPMERADQPDGGAARLKLARTYCNRCPVAAFCLLDGKQKKVTGIRGGLYLEKGRPVRDPKRPGRVSLIDRLYNESQANSATDGAA